MIPLLPNHILVHYNINHLRKGKHNNLPQQGVVTENQNHSAADIQKELNESERNILELHPSDDEELEIEDNIDDASLVSLNFSNPAPEQQNKESGFAGTANAEEAQK